MVNFIIICILGLILMLSSKNPIISIIGVIILIFILSGFNTSVLGIVFFVIIVSIVGYVIYDKSKKEQERIKEQEKIKEQERIKEEKRLIEIMEEKRRKEERIKRMEEERVKKEKIAVEEERKLKEKKELERLKRIEERKVREQKKLEEYRKQQEIKQKKELERKKIEQEQKRQKELEKQKKIKQLEEERKKKQELVEEYKSKIIKNPSILKIYKSIIENNEKFIEKEFNEFLQYYKIRKKYKFKDILWSFIIEILICNDNNGKKDIEKIALNIMELDFLKRQHHICIINAFAGTTALSRKDISNNIFNYYANKIQDNEYIEIYLQKKKEIERENKKSKQDLDVRINESKLVTLPLSLIYYLAMLLVYNLKLCDSIEEFNNNEELRTMYKNLESVTKDIAYIKTKLYPIYKKFYINSFNQNLSDNDFGIIIAMNTDRIEDLSEIKLKQIKSKRALINMVSKSLGEVTKANEDKHIIYICKILEEQNDIENKVIYDIITNIDDTLKSVTEITKLNTADKEKERILKGDFTKEIEFERLSFDIKNITNGYEFEEYVANLYKKLGYTIEEVTKKSGDQRCRCNCL